MGFVGALLRAILLPSFLICAFAQNPTATVVGTVKDATGALIAGVEIRIRNVETNNVQVAQTDAQGEYTIPNLAAGNYEAMVQHPGFHALKETGIELQIEQTARLEFKLDVGAVSESIEVTASVPLVNTENAVKGDVMVSQEVAEMPLNGRDFNDLAFLVPNVLPKAQGANGSALNINGARSDNTNFIIDGFNDQNPRGATAQARPNLDALQEFKMQTSGFSAEYGRLAGGVMNMVLKSGANQPHGTLFEFLRNDFFDARSFFDQDKTKLRRNQFGGMLSGPVRIPKIFNGQDRTFFLFSWESYRQSTGTTSLTRVPTALERKGNFSETPGALKDPLGGNFAGSIIPASRFMPIALKAGAFYPEPNRADVNNYIAVANDSDQWDSFLMKFDERISNKDNLSYRYTKRYNRTTNPLAGSAIPGFGNNVLAHQSLMGATFTHMFSPVLINETRVGFSRTASHTRGFNLGHDYAADFGLSGTTTDPQLIGFPRFTITGYAALGDTANSPVDFYVNNIQYGNTSTWVKDKHLLRFGGEVLRTQFFQPYFNNNRGTFNFRGKWTNQNYADFLLGLLDSDSRQVGTTPNYLFSTNYSVFAQDDWKVTPRLTLNVGTRYEISKPPLEKYGRMTNFIPEFNKLVLADDRTLQGTGISFSNSDIVTTAKALGIPQTMVYTRWGNIAPRLGFAWRPFGGIKTVVRGGYGIFYGTQLLNSVRNDLANVFPFAISQTVNRNASNPSFLTLASPFPVGPNLIGTVTNTNGFDLYAPTPYSQNWNVTVEREIGWASALEIAYVGAKGTHLSRKYDYNQPVRAAQYAPNFPRPYPTVGTINYYGFYANSIYNSGTVAIRRRFAHGFFYRVNYTFSKSIDEASQTSGNADGGTAQPQNSRCLRCERGRSDWDIGHVVTMNFSYEVPWRKNALVRGWQLTGTGRAYTGAPFTQQVSNVNLDLGDANRPDRIAKGTVANPNANRWYDVSAFPVLPTGSFRFGDSGRNILDGPGFLEMNLSLFKNFYFERKGSLQFRWEVFNAMNHANLSLPNINVNEPTAATVTASGTGRLMQFGLRYRF